MRSQHHSLFLSLSSFFLHVSVSIYASVSLFHSFILFSFSLPFIYEYFSFSHSCNVNFLLSVSHSLLYFSFSLLPLINFFISQFPLCKSFLSHFSYLPLSSVLPIHPLSKSGTHAELSREFCLQGSNRRHKRQETTPVVQDAHSPLVRVLIHARVIILSMKTC